MVALGVIVRQLFPDWSNYRPQLLAAPLAAQVALGVIVSPLVETGIMAGIVACSRRFLPRPAVILVCAAVLAGMHAISGLKWGLMIAWPFIVWSAVYVFSREVSFARAYWRTFSVHALHNAIGIALAASVL